MNLLHKKLLCSCWFYIQSIFIMVTQINAWNEYGKVYMEFVSTAILLSVITTFLYSKSRRIKHYCSILLIIYSIGLLFFGILVDLVAFPHTELLAILLIVLPIGGIFISLYLYYLICNENN